MVGIHLTVDAGAARGIAENMQPQRLERIIIKALQRAMPPIVAQIRANAPVGTTNVKKQHLAGYLRRSITFRVDTRRGLRARITAAPHGHLVETGHRIVIGGHATRLSRGTGKRAQLKMVNGVLTGKRGGRYAGQVIGQVPAHPFVQPVVAAAMDDINNAVSGDVERALVLAARIGKATGRGL